MFVGFEWRVKIINNLERLKEFFLVFVETCFGWPNLVIEQKLIIENCMIEPLLKCSNEECYLKCDFLIKICLQTVSLHWNVSNFKNGLILW